MDHTVRESLILYLAEINPVFLSVTRPVCYFESLRMLVFVRMGAVCACGMHSSVHVCVCVRRWCSSQLENESGKGAISVQLALIASTLFWWAAVLCEMTKCCVLGLPLWPRCH